MNVSALTERELDLMSAWKGWKTRAEFVRQTTPYVSLFEADLVSEYNFESTLR